MLEAAREATRKVQAASQALSDAMPYPIPNLRIERQPVRWPVGLLAGLIFGPVIACLLFILPSDEWVGTYPAYEHDFVGIAVFCGLCYGLPIGLGAVLLARFIQRFKWRRNARLMPTFGDQLHKTQADAIRPGPPADIARPPDEGITPAP